MRIWNLLPDVLALVAALAALGAGPGGPIRIRPRRRRLVPAVLTGLLGIAFVLELILGAATGELFSGFGQDRLSLFVKAAVLLALTGALAAADWDLEPVAAAGWRPLGWALLGGVGVLIAASASNVVLLWAGLAVAFACAAAALRVPRPALRGTRRDAARAAGGGWEGAAVLAAALLLAGLGLGSAWAASGHADLAGMAASGAFKAPGAALAGALALAAVGLALPLVSAGFVFAGGTRAGSAVSSGAAAAVAALGSGLVMVRLLGAAEASFAGWSAALQAAAAAALLAGAFGALASAGLRQAVGWLAVYQSGWLLAGFALHNRTGLAAGEFGLAAFAVALAVAPSLAAQAEDAGPSLLGSRRPATAAALAAVLASLAGAPPLAGFFADFAAAAELARSGGFWLLALATLGAALALAGLMRALRRLYLDPVPEAGRPPAADLTLPGLAIGGAAVVAAVVAGWGIFAYPILDLAAQGAAVATGFR